MTQKRPQHNAAPLSHIHGPLEFAAAFGATREVVEKLQLYESLLLTWQKAVNLVAPSTLDAIWHRHFADSAQLLSRGVKAKSWVDLGSGGGFPGLVIAILLTNHENHSVHLVESNSRKCAFLHEVARRTGAAVTIHEGRIEDLARGGQIGKADAVTSRALASLGQLLGLARPFFATDTIGLFLKGREAEQEIAEARKLWSFESVCVPSRTSSEGRVVEVTQLTS